MEKTLQRLSYETQYSARRIPTFIAHLAHDGLKEVRTLRDKDSDILQIKVSNQFHKWAEKWQKIEEARQELEEKQSNIEEATRRTVEAKNKISEIKEILNHTLKVDDAVRWSTLKDHRVFEEETPCPLPPTYLVIPPEPQAIDAPFNPKRSIIHKIFKKLWVKKLNKIREKFEKTHKNWSQEKQRITDENEKFKNDYDKILKNWNLSKEEFLAKQRTHNDKIDFLNQSYLEGEANAVLQYCEMVLNNSQYPESFPKDFELDYQSDSKVLIIEYTLPPLDAFPTVDSVKYIPVKKEMSESHLSQATIEKMFDTAMYQIAIRTLHEIFEADVVNAISMVSFNGWINFIDKATGQDSKGCILSLQANKDEFLKLDLARIDPKTCFKQLKGVGSSKLAAITPIQPILQISREDSRFVQSYGVIEGIEDSTNLATMDWEDFEHLIRELFEKEFSVNGGEVKVTQASKDGGVDAVAFDPDPIRGGKIVIQAKRYSNTVGVSAVRDLFGTVVNEGANKGILVSTANYGPEAYAFVKGKPLTLLNGANLLHLLEKHGHRARIDLKEAKLAS